MYLLACGCWILLLSGVPWEQEQCGGVCRDTRALSLLEHECASCPHSWLWVEAQSELVIHKLAGGWRFEFRLGRLRALWPVLCAKGATRVLPSELWQKHS